MKILNTMIIGSLLFGAACLHADDKTIAVNAVATYYDEKIIPSNIKNECDELGAQLSKSAMINLTKNGWSVLSSPNIDDSTQPIKLKLQIANALSSGNAFVGHRKSVSILAELYKDGELIDTYSGTRDSGGGVGAGFKGSCAVLARCVNTLGSDVTKWLEKQNI